MSQAIQEGPPIRRIEPDEAHTEQYIRVRHHARSPHEHRQRSERRRLAIELQEARHEADERPAEDEGRPVTERSELVAGYIAARKAWRRVRGTTGQAVAHKAYQDAADTLASWFRHHGGAKGRQDR
ncbi:hypothetical protein ACFL6X_09630 [Candidatus Latescibacterota bacterium]